MIIDEKAKVQIIISTYNCVNDIEMTMKSIRQQQYDLDRVYIVVVDFESVDGTYEKLLAYKMPHLGVYQIKGKMHGRTMVAEAARLAAYTYPGGTCTYQMCMTPGDVIYPEYLKTVLYYMSIEYANIPSALICETDIEKEDGSLESQKPLFIHKKIVQEEDVIEYVDRGYSHNVFCFGGVVGQIRHRAISAMNERIWWNKCVELGHEKNVIYIPDKLVCIKERFYEDELQEILMRWESAILFSRAYEAKYAKELNREFLEKQNKNLVQYVLWRCELMIERNDMHQARKCFKIVRVIDTSIEQSDRYKKLQKIFG